MVFVRQDVPHEDHSALEEDFQDQAVFVAAEIDDHIGPDQIGRPIIRPEIGK